MLRALVKTLKKFPLDFGQYEVRYTTKGKKIAYGLIGDGAGKRALDVGCRDGYWSEKLKAKGYEVTSIDVEPHYPGALTVDANLALPFPDHSFEVVWCAGRRDKEKVKSKSMPARAFGGRGIYMPCDELQIPRCARNDKIGRLLLVKPDY